MDVLKLEVVEDGEEGVDGLGEDVDRAVVGVFGGRFVLWGGGTGFEGDEEFGHGFKGSMRKINWLFGCYSVCLLFVIVKFLYFLFIDSFPL